jgi:putative ABC transport system substrate-binding protein
MNRSIVKTTLALFLTALLLPGGCTESPRVHRVGILCGLDYIAALVDGFKKRMTELGYIEGVNIVYDIQRTNFEPAREEEILRQFLADEVDLIVTCPTEVSILANKIGRESGTPLVFAFASIEETGLAQSIRRPGGHATGVRYPGPDVAVDRLEVLLELAPEARRIAIPHQRGYPIVPIQLETLKEANAARGLTLLEFPAADGAEIEHLFREYDESGAPAIDAILFIAEPLAVTEDAFIAISEYAARHRIPAGGAVMRTGSYRSLFGTNPDVLDSGRQAANQADKVLKGVPVGTIPVVSADNSLEIDYEAARQLGIEVPEGLLCRANRIIR